MDFIKEHWKWFAGGALAVVIITVIILSVCGVFKHPEPEENCVFIGEQVNLHKDFLIKVTDVTEVDQIEIYANSGDEDKSLKIGTAKHFIAVTVEVKRQTTSKEHKLDTNDFYIKDHTGWKAKNFYFQSVKDGFALSEKTFSKVKPIKDYQWFDKTIAQGETLTITLYFEFDKNISVFDTIMIFETDFFYGGGEDTGTDIVLANRQ